ncbi:MAG: AMP-binding protein, partial [Myxococcota bacterium]
MTHPTSRPESRRDWARHLGVDVDPTEALTAAGTLPALWERRWQESPEDICIVDLMAGERTLTAGDVLQQTAAYAAVLHKQGLRAGDRALFSAQPSLEYLLLYLAALRLGATIVPANTAYLERELRHIAGDSEAVVAVMDDPERAAWLDVPWIAPATATAGSGVDGPALDVAQPESLAMIAYTSGTTGRPK